jgi:hypothetical protein
MVEIYAARSFFEARLGFDPSRRITVPDWLTAPQQRLLELISGEVYHDGLGELGKAREKLKYYPRDVWLYVLAAQWTKISQEEAFIGRAGDVSDELGSQVVAGRIVREIIKLSFLMEKQYAPYSKWLGSAFSKLPIAKKLSPILGEVLLAKNWKARQRWLSKAYSLVAEQHNSLKITKPLPTRVSNYYERPYKVIFAVRFAEAIRQAIKDPQVKKIKTKIGAIDQFTDSTDVVENLSLRRSLAVAYK